MYIYTVWEGTIIEWAAASMWHKQNGTWWGCALKCTSPEMMNEWTEEWMKPQQQCPFPRNYPVVLSWNHCGNLLYTIRSDWELYSFSVAVTEGQSEPNARAAASYPRGVSITEGRSGKLNRSSIDSASSKEPKCTFDFFFFFSSFGATCPLKVA